MTTTRKIEIAAAIALLILGCVLLELWIAEREMRIRAEVTATAQQQIAAAKDKDIADRDAMAATYSATLTKQAAAVQTPAQAAQVIVRYMPPAIAQPITTVDRKDLPAEVQAKLPNAPTFSLLTPDQVKQVAKDELACDVTRNDLSVCKADITDLHTVVTAKTAESKAWETAAKGGTKWQRFGRVMKSVACAAGGAGVGALVTSKNPSGAAIGAGAGVVACSLF